MHGGATQALSVTIVEERQRRRCPCGAGPQRAHGVCGRSLRCALSGSSTYCRGLEFIHFSHLALRWKLCREAAESYSPGLAAFLRPTLGKDAMPFYPSMKGLYLYRHENIASVTFKHNPFRVKTLPLTTLGFQT